MTIGLTWRRTARRIKRLKETVLAISPDYSDRPTPDLLTLSTAHANERETEKKNNDIAQPHRSSLCESIRRARCPVKIKLAAFLAASKVLNDNLIQRFPFWQAQVDETRASTFPCLFQHGSGAGKLGAWSFPQRWLATANAQPNRNENSVLAVGRARYFFVRSPSSISFQKPLLCSSCSSSAKARNIPGSI